MTEAPASPEMPRVPLRVVAWETTRRCPLRCQHCRGAALDQDYQGELSTAEGLRLIDALAAYGRPLLILTGGEPMTRPDIYRLARHATDQGLRVVMAPCGKLITPDTARQMRAAGIRRISISLDGSSAATHDAFRGVPGAFDAALTGIAHAQAAGIEFQVNTTVTRQNVSDLPAIFELALSRGAAAFDVFFLVPTGRGAGLQGLEVEPEECERTLAWVAEKADSAPIRVKTTCAPHYARIQRQRHRATPVARQGRPPQEGGCLAGRGFIFVSHRGVLQPCGFLDRNCGDLRSNEFRFGALYESSPTLVALRDPSRLGGKCGVCEYRQACGGCRARAFARTGDFLAEEPSCAHVPAPAAALSPGVTS